LILQLDSPDSAFAAEAVRKLMACGRGFGNDRSLDRVNFFKQLIWRAPILRVLI